MNAPNASQPEHTNDTLPDYVKQMRRIHEAIKQDSAAGEEALRRLLPIALSDSGQSRRVATFLLGLYNGHRFPFDITNLRSLDYAILEDCLAVMRMDANAYQEVHLYFENGGQMFERLARDWGLDQAGKAA